MISIEIRPESSPDKFEEMEIYIDDEGIDVFMAMLRFLKNNETDHVHMMSEEWGGYDLSDVPHDLKNSSVKHVKMFKV